MFLNKKIFIVGAVIVSSMVLAGCKAYNTPSTSQSNQQQQSAGSQTPVSGNVISYSSSGFSPAELKVKVGDTVTFKNDSEQVVQVNSAPHPAHTSFPELNVGEIAKGESKSVTFTTVGTKKYHNHLNASESGTIVVE